MPSQAIALTIPSVHSGRLREVSVSSMRSTKAPPRCLANAQLNKLVRAEPTWNMPVGDGANLTLTSEGCGEFVTLPRLPCGAGWQRFINGHAAYAPGLVAAHNLPDIGNIIGGR